MEQARRRRRNGPRWPRPGGGDGPLPRLALLLTPPNSGSTAIADFLFQHPAALRLTPRYEGQWLVPGLSARNRWDPGKAVDWDSVRAVWAAALGPGAAAEGRFLIEKSPPHMMRHRAVAALFPAHAAVVNVRDPFACVASMALRYHDLDALEGAARRTVLAALTAEWAERAARLRAIAEDEGRPVLTYEAFCRDPARIFALFGIATEGVGIDPGRGVRVNDHPVRPITDMNRAQIGRLRAEDREVIAAGLAGHRAVLAFFGYADDPEAG